MGPKLRRRHVGVAKRVYFLDIAFARAKVCVEIDGRAFHDGAEAFESDRRRQNDLVRSGWVVLRFTWAMLTDDPDYVIGSIRAAIG